jgi:hypothetical protein
MSKQVSKEWRKIEGSAKWDFYKWLASLPLWSKVAAPVTPFVISVALYLKNAPWPVWMFLALFTQLAVILPLLVMVSIKRRKEIEEREKSIIPEQVLDVVVIPHGDNSEAIYLEVTNNSKTTRFSAEVRIIDVFPKRLFKTHKFEGSWPVYVKATEWSHAYEDLRHEMQIEANKSKRLKLAHVSSKSVGIGNQSVKLVGIDGEAMTWELPLKGQVLPYLEIEVILVGKGYTKPVIRQYKLGPATPVGPLEMKEIVA